MTGPPLFERLPEQYFTRILGAVAAAREQPGPRVIDLGRGNPDLPPPPEALDALAGVYADPPAMPVLWYREGIGSAVQAHERPASWGTHDG